MVSKEIVVQNQVGLHARPATFLYKKQMNSLVLSGFQRTNAR